MSLLRMLGLAAVFAAVYNLYQAVWRVYRCSEKTEGQVKYIDIKPEIQATGRGFRNCYFPVYEYEVDGTAYQKNGEEYSSRADYFKIGDRKQIRYNPNDPGECIVNGKSDKLVVGAILLVVGVALVFLG